MKQLRVKEDREHRFLGAIRFLDNATGGTIRRPFSVEAKGLRFVVNQSHLHIIVSAEGLEEHTSSFLAPPDQPAIGSKAFDVFVSDPLQEYLPRIKRIELPRNPDRTSENNLFKPIRVPMFSAASASLSPNWSILRISGVEVGSDKPEQALKGCLLRVVRESDGRLLARGLTDHRGEALIVVPGIPLHSFVTDEEEPGDDGELHHADWLASGDIVEQQTSVKLEAVADRALPWPVDPEVLEKNRSQWLCKVAGHKDADLEDSMSLKLKTGRTETITLFVKVPEGT